MSKRRELNMALLWLTLAVVMSLALLAWSMSAMAADLHLAWDASPGATYYNIQTADNSTITTGSPIRMNWGEIRRTPGPATTFTWVGAKDNRITFFRVQACNDVDCATNYTKGVWYYPFSPPNQAGSLRMQ